MTKPPNSQNNLEDMWYVSQETMINHFLFKCVIWAMSKIKLLSSINNGFSQICEYTRWVDNYAQEI
jgi:hypothetical protein